jgi:hypothetical protein
MRARVVSNLPTQIFWKLNLKSHRKEVLPRKNVSRRKKTPSQFTETLFVTVAVPIQLSELDTNVPFVQISIFVKSVNRNLKANTLS